MLIVRSPVRISSRGGGTDPPSYCETFGGAVFSAAINEHGKTLREWTFVAMLWKFPSQFSKNLAAVSR